jgi:uncharacterized protein with PIN domain
MPELGVTPPALATEAINLLFTLSDGTKVKQRLFRMRACNERNAKGKVCAGHLKRFYRPTPEMQEKLGKDAELYRCEHCRTLYIPNPDEAPRTKTLAW